jgi:hypothetical protein
MNAPTFYNPCDDGFPAKAWECLRRSAIFFKSCSELIADIEADDEEFADKWGVYSDHTRDLFMNFHHPFHQCAVYWLFDNPKIKFDPDAGRSPVTFPELDAEIQNDIRASFERRSARIEPADSKPASRRSAIPTSDVDWDQWETIVRLPKVVWDNDHKREVLKQIKSFLGDPLSTKKRLKPNGSTLGTKSEWNSFLRVERWRSLGYPPGRAANFAAYEISDRVAFSGTSNQIKQQAETYWKSHKRASKVETHVERIEKWINCVFPRFDLGNM